MVGPMGCWGGLGDWDCAALHWSGRSGGVRRCRYIPCKVIYCGGHHIYRLVLGGLVWDRTSGVLGKV